MRIKLAWGPSSREYSNRLPTGIATDGSNCVPTERVRLVLVEFSVSRFGWAGRGGRGGRIGPGGGLVGIPDIRGGFGGGSGFDFLMCY